MVEVALALDFFLPDAVRFIPVQVSQANVSGIETDPGDSLRRVHLVVLRRRERLTSSSSKHRAREVRRQLLDEAGVIIAHSRIAPYDDSVQGPIVHG